MRPGNRYARERGTHTLGRLSDQRMVLVAVCRTCKHRRVLYIPRLIERFGAELPRHRSPSASALLKLPALITQPPWGCPLDT
jgi:hypothetical protein